MEIQEFQKSFRNREINIRPYIITVAILLSIILVIMIINNRIKDYYVGKALVKDNNLVILINNDELNKITTNKKIIIERNMFTYNIISINEMTYLNSLYNEVTIKVSDLDESMLINNNSINFKIITEEKTIFEYLLKVVKGEWHIQEISKEELRDVDGGGLSILAAAGIVAGAIFVIGVIDGYVRPQKCND